MTNVPVEEHVYVSPSMQAIPPGSQVEVGVKVEKKALYDSARDNRDEEAAAEREVVGGRAVVRRAGAVDIVVDGTRGKNVVEMPERVVVGRGRVDVAVRVKRRVDSRDDVIDAIGEVALVRGALEVTRLL